MNKKNFWNPELSHKGFNLIFKAKNKAEQKQGARLIEESNNFYYLADLYLDGSIIPKNLKEAFRITNKGINNNCHHCKILLAAFYENGFYVNKNIKQAFEILNKLEQEGLFEARAPLAKYYEKGIVVKQDYEKAYEFYDFHYLIPSLRCIKGLERLYRNGNGVEQSIELADFYLEKSKILSQINNLSLNLAYKGMDYDQEEYSKLNGIFEEGFEQLDRFNDC